MHNILFTDIEFVNLTLLLECCVRNAANYGYAFYSSICSKSTLYSTAIAMDTFIHTVITTIMMDVMK